MVARLRLKVARRRGVPDFPFVRKFSTTKACCVPMAAARVAARCEIYLSAESCSVDLSTAKGEVLSGREPQSGYIMVRQRGAIE